MRTLRKALFWATFWGRFAAGCVGVAWAVYEWRTARAVVASRERLRWAHESIHTDPPTLWEGLEVAESEEGSYAQAMLRYHEARKADEQARIAHERQGRS